VRPRETSAPRRRKPKPRLVPHGPGGTLLRPAARPAPRPVPTPRQRALATERSYGSQGRQVERTARRQRAAQARRRLLAPERAYRSQGRAVERQANRLNVQTRAAHPRHVDVLRALGHFLGGPARAQEGTATAPSVFTPGEARAFGSDFKALGAGPFIGGYELGRGGYEALLHGNTSRLGRLGKGVAAGVIHSAPGELVQGHPGKAVTAAQQHPLFALLDTAAAAGVAGRVAGAGARTLTGHRVGSTVRPPLAHSLDSGAVKAGAYHEREYAKGLERQVVQRYQDSKREPVRDADGKVVTVKQRGRMVPVLKATPGEVKRGSQREADVRAGRANALERLRREVVARELKARGIRGRKAKDLVAMVVEGTVTSGKSFADDLRRHADRLDAEHTRRLQEDPKGYRHSGEALMNRRRAEVARDAAGDSRVTRQADKIVAEGERIGGKLNELERHALARGVISDSQRARRSALIPAAIEHLGGRYFREHEHAALERAALAHERSLPEGSAARAAARDERIAVSGRDPAGVRAHEATRAEAERLRGVEKTARARVASLHNTRQRLIGAQSSRRGVRRGSATRAERTKLEKLDREIKAARKAAHDAGVEARKAEHTHTKTPLPRIQEAVRRDDGRHLSDADIEQALRDKGRDPATVAYLPHVPPGDRAFHARFGPGTRPVLDKAGPEGRRTGEAYRKGATSSTADLIQQQGARLTTQVTKAEQLDSLVGERGLRHPDYAAVEAKAAAGGQLSGREKRLLNGHGYFTGREAAEIGQRVEYDTGHGLMRGAIVTADGEKLVPMRAFADRLSPTTKKLIADDMQGPAGMESLHLHLLNDRIIDPADLARTPARNVVLVNADLVDRLEQHLRPAGEIERFVQMLNRPFRFAVLAQPRWLTGNFVEPYLVRLPTVGSGAINVFGLGNDIRIAGKILKTMKASKDPRVRAAADEIEAQHFGGLFIGGRGASNRRLFEDSKVYAQMVAKVPATRQMYDVAHKLGQVLIAPGRLYFWANREGIEKWAQKAAFGRSARRDMAEFFGSWQKATRFGEEAAQEAARGLVNTPTQLRFLKEQHKLLGQYSDFSPRLRRAVQGPMPFLPWALNAARFVYWTMPTQRTILTSLLLKTNQAVAKEWQQQHADLPPSLQETTLAFDARRKDGGFTPGIRYTPYGLTAPATEGNLEGFDQALPALRGPAQALLQGQDPFGNPLKTERSASNPQGTVRGLGPKFAVAGNELAEALIPYLAQARRLRERGETALPTSNILSPKTKPGTSHGMSALRRTFDPFRPTYVKAGGGGAAHPLSAKAAERLGLDPADLHDLQREARQAAAGLDKADLEELRQLARGGP
jgi:hypothetical protein